MLRRFFLVFLAFGLMLALASCGGKSGDDDAAADDDNDASPADDDASPADDDASPTDEVEVSQVGDTLVIRNNEVALLYYLQEGRYSVYDADGAIIVEDASAKIYANVLLPYKIWRSGDLTELRWTQADADNPLGSGKTITIERGGVSGAPTMNQSFTVLSGLSVVLATVTVGNASAADLPIGAIYPLDVVPPDASVYLGAASDLRVLSNGFLNYLDFSVPIYPAEGPTISDWSGLIYNLQTGRSFSLGFLGAIVSQPIVYAGPTFGPTKGVVVQADCEYDPTQNLAPNGTITTETMALDFGINNPFAALETYADRVRLWLNVKPWVERHPDLGVPAGWNSWSGGGGSGGYGQSINEQIILDNMNFADQELRRWGMTYFQIDDGWEVAVGDWQVDTTKFPDHGSQNGIAWLMSQAKALGFRTGLWMAAFIADPSSQIVQQHPEYFAKPWPSFVNTGKSILDLSKPVVQTYLTGLMNTLVSWGIQWFKLDFAYDAVLSTGWYDPTLTRGEFYREGVKTLRTALGPDIFFANVAIVGWNYDLVDAVRLTMDVMPVWEGEVSNPYGLLADFNNQGMKPMYRDAARRYYLNNHLWINHPDLIFFRSDPGYPPITMDESTTFATSVALQGGLVKFGDKLVDLTGPQVGVLRSIMPVYGKAGRPLDMFQREFPEVWALSIADFPEPYFVLGLLDWGINRDLTVLPYAMMADEARQLGADFADAGLDPSKKYLAFEFWTQQFLGEVQGSFKMQVPAETSRVVALREELGRPQLVGENRHVLGGVTVVKSMTWDSNAKTLTGVSEGSVGTTLAPFEHQLTFYVPSGYTASNSQVTVPSGWQITGQSFTTSGPLATLNFTVETTAAQTAHPDVTWVVSF